MGTVNCLPLSAEFMFNRSGTFCPFARGGIICRRAASMMPLRSQWIFGEQQTSVAHLFHERKLPFKWQRGKAFARLAFASQNFFHQCAHSSLNILIVELFPLRNQFVAREDFIQFFFVEDFALDKLFEAD